MTTQRHQEGGFSGSATTAASVPGVRNGFGGMPAVAQALALNFPWPAPSADASEYGHQAWPLLEAAGRNMPLQAADTQGVSMHAHLFLQQGHTHAAGGIFLDTEISANILISLRMPCHVQVQPRLLVATSEMSPEPHHIARNPSRCWMAILGPR
jgi:hypothetical protein